jgi:UTP--glucose-1-phosphate uridylyltransferase
VKIKKAVITAAAESQRTLPLQTLVDVDGAEKSVLGILVEQALAANLEEVCVVVYPGDEARYASAVSRHLGHVRFIAQPQPLGYAHALYCARDFLAGEPFLHLVGDHIFINPTGVTSTLRHVELAAAEACAVSAVQPTRESLLPSFGAVAGPHVPGRPGLYRVETVIEKPTPTEAEQRLGVPGMRAGYYLCFFGIHVLTPGLMDILERQLARCGDARLPLSPALAELAQHEQYLAVEDPGRRYNIGARYGLLTAQLALALQGRDRAEILAQLVELLATRETGRAAAGGGQ